MTHICVSKLTTIGSDNGLSPGWRQTIIWTSAGILFIGPLETNLSEILIEIYTFSFKKMHLKMSPDKWWPFFPGLNVLKTSNDNVTHHYDEKFEATAFTQGCQAGILRDSLWQQIYWSLYILYTCRRNWKTRECTFWTKTSMSGGFIWLQILGRIDTIRRVIKTFNSWKSSILYDARR